MPAYFLVVFAVLSRIALAMSPHPEWFNFTAVGGALLYFGARRGWREMVGPLVALMTTDYLLTTVVYAYPFRWQMYVTTWLWYAMAMMLGWVLLRARTTVVRVAAGALLGPTSFFLVSNYAVWASGTMYPPTWSGLMTCLAAGLPFYRNDLFATALVAGAAFGIPVLVARLRQPQVVPAVVRK